jgi:hypothetical protein
VIEESEEHPSKQCPAIDWMVPGMETLWRWEASRKEDGNRVVIEPGMA